MSDSEPVRGWGREWRWVVPLMAAVALAFAWRVLVRLDHWGIQDWDFANFMAGAARRTVLAYRQFPMWNPWWCGGTPMLARPECSVLTPAFLLPLTLGEIAGLRLLIPMYLAVGLVGTYCLGRQLAMGPAAAVLCALVYMCGGPFTSHLTVGNTWVLPMGLIPWVIFHFLRGLANSSSGCGLTLFGRECSRRGAEAAEGRLFRPEPLSLLRLASAGQGGRFGQGVANPCTGTALSAVPVDTNRSVSSASLREILSKKATSGNLDATAGVSAGIWCGVCLALIWLGGAPYLFVMTVFGLGLYTVFGLLLREVHWREAVRTLGVAGAVAFGLCAVQLIPCLEFTLQYPRVQSPYRGFSVESLVFGLLNRDQTLHAVEALEKIPGFWRGVSHGMNETGTYVGVVPLLLAAVGLVAHGRRCRVLVLAVAVCVWLSLGPRAAPLSLWNWLHDLPVFSIMRVPERFRLLFLLGVAIFAGLGLEAVGRRLRRVGVSACRGVGVGGREGKGEREGKFHAEGAEGAGVGEGGWFGCRGRACAVLVLVGFVFVDLMVVVGPLWNQTFTIRPMTLAAAPGGAFVQTAMFYPMASGRWAQEGDDTLRIAWSSHYPALKVNQGIVEGNDEIPTPRMAVPVDDPGYRGEVFLFQTAGTARYTRWSPNVLTMAVAAAGEGYLVVNQNFFTGWRVRGGGKVVEKVGGLLAVRVGPADREVEIFYRPWSVVVGAGVSAVTWGGLGLWGWWRWRRRGRRT